MLVVTDEKSPSSSSSSSIIVVVVVIVVVVLPIHLLMKFQISLIHHTIIFFLRHYFRNIPFLVGSFCTELYQGLLEIIVLALHCALKIIIWE